MQPRREPIGQNFRGTNAAEKKQEDTLEHSNTFWLKAPHHFPAHELEINKQKGRQPLYFILLHALSHTFQA